LDVGILILYNDKRTILCPCLELQTSPGPMEKEQNPTECLFRLRTKAYERLI